MTSTTEEHTTNKPTTSEESSIKDGETTGQQQPLGLPAPGEESTVLNVGGEAVKLDHLGPMVVNRDGTLSRIANWEEISDIERKNTLRILGKRNQLRLDGLKNAEAEGEGSTST